MAHNYFKKQLLLNSEIERLVDLVVKDQALTEGEHCVISCCQDISPVIQKGPMCGLVCLTMAAQLLQQGDTAPSTHNMDKSQSHPECILEYAVCKGYSRRGEMFSANAMEKIAMDHLQLQSHVVPVSDALLDLVVSTICGNVAVLVPYDADKDHTPCLARGHCAHWCLLVGLCIVNSRFGGNYAAPVMPKLLECCQQAASNRTHYVVMETGRDKYATLIREMFENAETLKENLDKDSIYVFTRHGKTSHLGLWNLKDLLLSNGNLVEVDPRRSDPLQYVIPQGGLEDGLRKKVVFVAKT